jgi:RHS repeat-associated protein
MASRRYDTWGQVEAGGSTSGYAFTGREWDAETGLHYYRARYYDPSSARLLSEDPKGFAAEINFYRYVFNNPVRLTDPFGLEVRVCFRQMHGIPGKVLQVPHSVMWPTTKGCTGTGFGPAANASTKDLLRGKSVPGQYYDEEICGEDGKPKPEYFACPIVDPRKCMEECVIKEMKILTKKAAPKYRLGKKGEGFQCTDWTDMLVQTCQAQCAGKQ